MSNCIVYSNVMSNVLCIVVSVYCCVLLLLLFVYILCNEFNCVDVCNEFQLLFV